MCGLYITPVVIGVRALLEREVGVPEHMARSWSGTE
jgi:hypothetical protein